MNMITTIERNEQRGQLRLKVTSDFNQSTWAYSTDSLVKSLFGKRFEAQIVDISEGGLSFISEKPVYINDHITTIISYKTYNYFPMSGRVRSCEPLQYVANEFSGTYFHVRIQLQYNTGDPVEQYKRLLKRLARETGVSYEFNQ